MTFDLTTGTAAIAALVSLAIGLITLVHSRHERGKAPLFATCLVISMAMGTFLYTRFVSDVEQVTTLVRAFFALIALVPLGFLYFYSSLHRSGRPIFGSMWFFFIAPALYFSLSSLVPEWLVTSVEFSPVANIHNALQINFVPSSLYLYVAYIAVFAGLSLTALYIQYRSKSEEKKRDAIVLMLGLLVTVGIFIAGQQVDPTTDLANSPHWINILAVLPLLGSATYTLLRKSLFHDKVIAVELVVLFLWLLILARLFLSQNNLDLLIGAVFLGLVILAGIILIRSVMTEVVQREKLEGLTKRLERANTKLKHVDLSKSEFLSIAAHQLRGPITLIKGYSSMILEGSYGKPTKKISEPIERIHEASQNLSVLVADLLDVSKIDQGGFSYEMEPMSLLSATKSVIEENKLKAKAKKISIKLSVDSDNLYIIKGDSLKLRQAITNLVDNAIKYTNKGTIFVALDKVYYKRKHWIELRVTDNGIGIDPAKVDDIFGKFSRTKQAKNKAEGSGLGLYLAKQIVDAHKGNIWAESSGVGKGATFIIRVPASRGAIITSTTKDQEKPKTLPKTKAAKAKAPATAKKATRKRKPTTKKK